MSRVLLRIALLVAVLLLVGELIARYGLGLGTPPLTVTHPRMEYIFAPNQDVRRFGNRQLYNELSMRNAPISDWGEARRILVFGDSVLNGGNLTDHEALATTMASQTIGDAVFANISAGSWGLDNIFGWIETYGLLDAGTAILVLSSHDAGDRPSFAALNALTHPTARPASALVEAVTRYLPRYMPKRLADLVRSDSSQLPDIETEYVGREGIEVLPELVDRFANEGVRLRVVLHATLTERQLSDDDALAVLSDGFEERAVPVLRLADFDDNNEIAAIYRDDIHINNGGQVVLERALLACDAEARLPAPVENGQSE
jgi:uncharacterized protein (UPF0216 family)